MNLKIPKKILDNKDQLVKLELKLIYSNDRESIKVINNSNLNYNTLSIPDITFNKLSSLAFICTYNEYSEIISFPDKFRCVHTKKEKPTQKENKLLLKKNDNVIYSDTQEDKELIMSIVDSIFNNTMEINNDYLGSKNLIYFTAAKNVGYIDLLELSLKSIHAHNPIKNFDVLVITTDELKAELLTRNITKKFNLKFHIISEPVDGIEASMTKLNIFDYLEINNYRNILFLDCDIICIDSINSLFDKKLTTDKLLTVVNSLVSINSHNSIYHGLSIDDPIRVNTMIENNQLPFNAGQFMFKNSMRMKEHFENIKWFSSVWPGKFFFEQCFMNRYFCGFNMTDSTILEPYFIITSSVVANSFHKVHNETTKFIHFTAPPLDYTTKLTFITDYCNAHQLPL